MLNGGLAAWDWAQSQALCRTDAEPLHLCSSSQNDAGSSVGLGVRAPGCLCASLTQLIQRRFWVGGRVFLGGEWVELGGGGQAGFGMGLLGCIQDLIPRPHSPAFTGIDLRKPIVEASTSPGSRA